MSERWRRWLGLALALAALGFLGYTIASEYAALRAYDWEVRPLALAASIAGLVLVLTFGVWVWTRVLACVHAPDVAFRDLLRVWFLSSLARYVPGKIWQFVGAAQMAPGAGVPGPVLVSSLVIHMGFTLLGAAIVALGLLLPTGARPEPALATLVAVMAAASTLLVHPRILGAALRLVPRRLHAPGVRWTGRWRDGLVVLALSVVSWILYGLAFTLFVASIVAVPASAVPPLIGANALAFLVGYLVFIAPAGLGAREAALALLLGPYAPAGIAALVAVAARLWTIAAEVLGAAAVLGLARRRSRS